MLDNESGANEITGLKKNIIIFSGVAAFIFLVFKLCLNFSKNLGFYFYSTEIVILLCSICIFIGLLVVKTDINNEELIKREQKYFDIAFKVFLWVSFIGYALVLPKTIISNNNSRFSANLLINILMMSSMFLGYGILRLKKIYFNFKFISKENKIYYKAYYK